MTIKLVTDSGAGLPAGWVDRYGITVVDLHMLREAGEVVGTAGATPEDLAETYQGLLDDPDCTGVVSVHLSARLSRTWESAAEAARAFGGRVLVVDSQGGGMHMGAAVAQCAWAAREGLGLSATYDLANRLTRDATTLVSVDSLEPLRRGGRLGTAIAVVGTALSMKPVLEIRAGHLRIAARTRTTSKAHAKMREMIREAYEGRDVLVSVQHVHAEAEAHAVADEIRKETRYPERVSESAADPVLGWHLGEGTVAVSVVPLESDEFPIPDTTPQD